MGFLFFYFNSKRFCVSFKSGVVNFCLEVSILSSNLTIFFFFLGHVRHIFFNTKLKNMYSRENESLCDKEVHL